MTVSNAQVATQLSRLAEVLQAEGENRFKIKAYRNAAKALQQYPRQVSDLVAEGEDLTQIPGIGKGISAAIAEIVSSGTLSKVKTAIQDLPKGTTEIAEASGLSLKDAQRLIKKLKIHSVAGLKEALNSGELARALGTRLEFKVKQGLLGVRRLLWTEAEEVVQSFLEFFQKHPAVTRAEPAGSFRRLRETTGTLRFVIISGAKDSVIKAVEAHGGVEKKIQVDGDRVSFTLSAGPLLTLHFATEKNWGDVLVAETGSIKHLEATQKTGKKNKKKAQTEEEWYELRGLPYLVPELREGRGETELNADTIPKLIALSDMRGDLHAHSTASDGANSIAEMAEAAMAKGYTYLAITDHSKNLKITNGLDVKRLRRQMAEIDKLNGTLKNFRVLKGSEVDILEDGTLDFPNEVLKDLDIVICSIHSRFGLDKDKQTDRLLRAIENKYVTFVGHLTGRLLLRRPGYDLHIEKIFKAIRDNGKIIEINSSPDRLDIDDALALKAKEMGILIAVNTDAHSIQELDFMRYGLHQARRGQLTSKEVLNTLPLNKLLTKIRATQR